MNINWLYYARYYDLEKWEAKRQQKHELKALKKARENTFSIADDEKRHDQLHRGATSNKYGICVVSVSKHFFILLYTM